jgi:hypothetical protein
MTVTISNKDCFLDSFLGFISKVSENAVLTVADKNISSLLSTSDSTVIVHSLYSDDKIKGSHTLNIPDLKKLHRLFSCIGSKDFEITINTNNISYSSDDIRFKYHLFDDGIISTPKLNIDKLNDLKFDGSFSISQPILINLIKASSINIDSSKLYLTFKNNSVFGELTDKSKPNIDSFDLKLTEDYVGSPVINSMPLNFEIFRIISSIRAKTFNVKIHSKMSIVLLEISDNFATHKIVISALAN